jgi:hypothetical protein
MTETTAAPEAFSAATAAAAVGLSRSRAYRVRTRLYCWAWLWLEFLLPRRRFWWVQVSMNWLDNRRAVGVREQRDALLQTMHDRVEDACWYAVYGFAADIAKIIQQARIAGMDSWDILDGVRDVVRARLDVNTDPPEGFGPQAA